MVLDGAPNDKPSRILDRGGPDLPRLPEDHRSTQDVYVFVYLEWLLLNHLSVGVYLVNLPISVSFTEPAGPFP